MIAGLAVVAVVIGALFLLVRRDERALEREVRSVVILAQRISERASRYPR